MAQHPGCTVLTVFAGVPEPGCGLPAWDARCGFQSAREAVLTRREEDHKALATLAAHPVWLDFLDSQYGQPTTTQALAQALHEALERLDSSTVLVPLGLFHSDHLMVHTAAQYAMAMGSSQAQGRSWRIYEEVPYRGMPHWTDRRIQAVRQQGLHLTLEVVPAEHPDGLKAQAARCYASQWHALGPTLWKELSMPERFWIVHAGGASAATPRETDPTDGVTDAR